MVKLCKPYLPDKSISCWLNPLSTKFSQNTLIVRFNELKLFSVKTFGNVGTFYNCSKLKEIDCYNIERLQHNASLSTTTFAGCTSLPKVYYPNLKRVAQWSFTSNTANTLANPEIVVIGASLATIDNAAAFAYVSTKKIFIYTKTPPSFSSALTTSGTTNTQYYVPDDSFDAYYSSSTWANLKSKLKKLSEYTGDKPWEDLYPKELGIS